VVKTAWKVGRGIVEELAETPHHPVEQPAADVACDDKDPPTG
jgi:hypothetical protein